jgi:hypothetical protein
LNATAPGNIQRDDGEFFAKRKTPGRVAGRRIDDGMKLEA